MKILMHRIHAAAWLAALTFFAIACGGPEQKTENAATGAVAPPDASGKSASNPLPAIPADAASRVLVVSQGSDVLSFDPYASLESPSFSVQKNIFDGLTDYDAGMKVVPCLASSWENVGPTEWLFHLRGGVVFHDGGKFTADDAVFSIRRAIDWPKSRVGAEVQTIEKVEAVDPQTLRITTRGPDAILPLRLASVLIMQKASTEAALADTARGEGWLATHAVGTGPYTLAEWRRDDFCELTAFEGYWGGAPKSVKKMRFLAASNDATRMALLQNGDIDIFINVPPRSVKGVEVLPGRRLVRQPGLRLIYLGLDTGRDKSPGVPGSPPNPLRDLKIREAINCAIDRPLIINKVMGGNAAEASQLFPDAVTGYDPGIAPVKYDPERAKKLLAEAGYEKGFYLRLDGPNDRYVNDADIMQAIAAQLARVGIRVQVNARPKSKFFEDEHAGECSFFLIGWSNSNGDGAGTFDHLLHTFTEGQAVGGSNTSTRYSNPELDALSQKASVEFDAAKRNAILQEAGRIAMRDLPHIPLHFQMDIYTIADRIAWTPRRDTEVRGVDVNWAK